MKLRFTILIVLGLILLTGLFTLRRTSKEQECSSQKSAALRKKFRVPPIEPDWVISRQHGNVVLWTNAVRGVKNTIPSHLSKTVVDSGGVVKEIDRFHYQLNDSLGYRLVLSHTFEGAEWVDVENKFITYSFDEYAEVNSSVVDGYFADSVLSAWNDISKRRKNVCLVTYLCVP